MLLSLSGSAGLDFSILLHCTAWSGSSTFTLGMLRAGGHGLFVEDFAQMDSSSLLRAPAQLAFTLSVCGVACFGFAASTPDYLNPGFTLLLRSCAWLDASVLTLSFSSIDSFSPVRGPVRSGLSMPIVGVAAIKGDAAIQDTVSVQGAMQVGLTCSIYGSVCFGFFIPTLDYVTIGPSLSSRNHCQAGFALLVLGCSCVGVSTLLLDCLCADFAVSFRTMTCLNSSLLPLAGLRAGCMAPASDSSHLGPVPSVQNFLHAELAFLLMRGAEFGSPLFALDFLHLESVLSPRSFAHLGFLMPLLGVSATGFLLLLRVCSCSEVCLLIFGGV